MLFPRSSGILLHPTSLPGRYGIGDLGRYAYRFVDYLLETGQSIWQVLPLGPTSYGDSPYQSLSTFAGNTHLISFDKLIEIGWLKPEDFADLPDFPKHRVDYGWIFDYRPKKLTLAYERFKATNNAQMKTSFEEWCERQSYWLEDYALFFALKEENGGKPWVEWANKDEALYKPEALKAARTRLADQIKRVKFLQWVFFSQWHELRSYANSRGVRIVGDIPIFVAHDSSDVWANRENYFLDERGNPTVVAGVPPDYFSPTGQYWGNPLYRWDRMKADGYQWWVERLRAILELVDVVRIDHFRAFEDYWEVPNNKEQTAVNGQWLKGPNVDLFKAFTNELGKGKTLPIIAEDLGDITDAVIELRNKLGLPGMKIIQFGFSGPDNEFLPHNYESNNFIVYTGTHDNNTARGWWDSEGTEGEKRYFQSYVDREINSEPHWDMIRIGMMSVAHTFVAPLQDILGFGADTRMNIPGRASGNWTWRFTEEWFDYQPAKQHLAHLTGVYNRWRADGD